MTGRDCLGESAAARAVREIGRVCDGLDRALQTGGVAGLGGLVRWPFLLGLEIGGLATLRPLDVAAFAAEGRRRGAAGWNPHPTGTRVEFRGRAFAVAHRGYEIPGPDGPVAFGTTTDLVHEGGAWRAFAAVTTGLPAGALPA